MTLSNQTKVIGIFLSAAGLAIFLLFITYDRKADEAIVRSNMEFLPVKRESVLHSKVREIYCPRELRCATPPVWIILLNYNKVSVNTDDYTFVRKISVGDSLVKEAGSDTLFLFKEGSVTKFLIK